MSQVAETLPGSPAAVCAAGKRSMVAQAKVAVASPDEDRYDVQWARLDVALTNTNTTISGNATTRAAVTAGPLAAYVFELNPQLTIDSAKINGTVVPVSNNGVVRTASLPTPLAAGAVFTAQVWYRGTITGGSSFFSTGLINATSPTWGTQITYTLAEPYDARDWWPCKQSLRDKLDSVQVWITVPSGLMAGSNGLLQTVTPLNGGSLQRYQWSHRHPIDYYLVSAAVAPYTDYRFYAPLGANDSVLVQNYIYNNPQTLPFWKARLDSTRGMIGQFSRLFGRYPFADEKYGHCMAPLSGGMEHQTMTTLGTFEPTLVAHELAHQWWGDHVTCGTWGDLWLNEGFATYAEYLFVDSFRGKTAGAAYLSDIHDQVLFDAQTGVPLDSGSVFVADTANEQRLFSSRLTYNKGGSVLHTLRYLAGNDSLFFASLRAYRQLYGGSTAVTADLRQVLETAWGRSLDTFFREWIYGEGYPRFSAEWAASNGTVYLRLNQTGTVPASVPFFHVPVEVRFSGPAGDTTVKVYSTGGSQDFQFAWNAPVSGLTIDPADWLLNRVGAIVQNPTLGTPAASIGAWAVQPNPTQNAWTVSGVGAGTVLRLSDMEGHTVWQGVADGTATVVPAMALAPGTYLLLAALPNGEYRVTKLLRD